MSSDFKDKQKYHFFVGVGIDIGDRRSMEDELSVQISKHGVSYFGVFDGHAGTEASSFVKDNVCKLFFEKSPNNLKNKEKLEQIMTETYQKVDDDFLIEEQESLKNSTHQRYNSGSTATSLVVKPCKFVF